MEDLCLLIGVVAGVVTVAAYVLMCVFKYKTSPKLSEAVIIFICCCGLMAGIKLCYIVLTSDIFKNMKSDIVYIFVGGLAIIWVSFATIYGIFKTLKK